MPVAVAIVTVVAVVGFGVVVGVRGVLKLMSGRRGGYERIGEDSEHDTV